ncbi:MAG: DNA recombination protein RmuC [Streptosporangiaceae bacterium]
MNVTAVVLLIVGLLVGLTLGAVLAWLLVRGREAALAAELRAAKERARDLDERLGERFQSLAAQALSANNEQFLQLADSRMRETGTKATGELEQRKQAIEQLVSHLRESLGRVEGQLRESEASRHRAHAELSKQVDFVRESNDRLRTETSALVTALRRPEARGRWGELQLRRVAELAGMANHCDFEEQASVATDGGTLRPDMVVHLAGGKRIVVDSKVSLAAYLEAVEVSDEGVRTDRLKAHARHLKDHIDRLAAKSYWSAFSPAPEFVVLFIPGEAFLAPALDRDPGLLEYAISRHVHIATPTTLVTMLRTAQYAWQQAALSDNARAVFELGKELYDRLGSMGGHVERLGKALSGAVRTYNQAVGSLEGRVLVTARKLRALELVDSELDQPRTVEDTTRSLSAPELLADAAQARQVRALPLDQDAPENVAMAGSDAIAANGRAASGG